MKTEEIENDSVIAQCDVGGNCFEFYIGTLRLGIYANPGEENSYEIMFLRYDDDGGEYVIFMQKIPLTPEEYDAAWESYLEDFMFVDDVDSLVAKHVAKDIFSFFLCNITIRNSFYDMSGRYKKEWASYVKYLLHERMEGRTIADYEPGYEPKEDE